MYQLTRKNNLPAFTSSKIWKSILTPKSKIPGDCIREIGLHQKFHIAGFDIEAFPVFHDAPETVGFHICFGDKKITIVTDLGHICPTASPYIKAANLLVIESNYDEEMLVNGNYPQYLKKRIQSDHGHLGNHQTFSDKGISLNGPPRISILNRNMLADVIRLLEQTNLQCTRQYFGILQFLLC